MRRLSRRSGAAAKADPNSPFARAARELRLGQPFGLAIRFHERTDMRRLSRRSGVAAKADPNSPFARAARELRLGQPFGLAIRFHERTDMRRLSRRSGAAAKADPNSPFARAARELRLGQPFWAGHSFLRAHRHAKAVSPKRRSREGGPQSRRVALRFARALHEGSRISQRNPAVKYARTATCRSMMSPVAPPSQ